MKPSTTKHRPLRIAQVAPIWTSVPPATYGGTELMVHLLTEELVRRGHDVTLFSTANATTRAALRAVSQDGVSEAMARGEAYEYGHYACAHLADALRDAARFDVIHCHLGCAYVPLGTVTRTPVVHTVHIVLSVDDQWVLRSYPQVPIVAVSRYQSAAVPVDRRWCPRVIHHGIDFDAYEFSPSAGKYLAFLGRMGPQKSPLDAIHIAREVRMPLVLAGKPQNAEEETYFVQKIKPHIDGRNVTYVGPVNHAQKNELLKNAAALLFPIQGEEAFGLVMIEAMACGTPVIACKLASVPEVIDYGTTGFYAESGAELAGLVPRCRELSREVVRAHARKRFSHQRMVDDYLDLYHGL